MSDIGIYQTLEDEIVAALTTPAIAGVASVTPTVSARELVLFDVKKRPAIGVIDAESEKTDEMAANGRIVGAGSTWHIAIVVDSKRSWSEARARTRELLEEVRDRVHNLQTMTSSRGSFKWESDKYVDVVGDDKLVAAIATFVIPVNFGV